ncbi:MAG: glycosyltransferase family 9 protein [Ignavibacteriae bacterium]|nr:glycosyltransferase family 9 protein [Ignavibacteriota bacterium]
MKIDKNEIHRILVIKFGGMGDILLSTPVLPNLRNYFKSAHIDYLTLIRNRDILMDNEYIDRVLTYDSSIDKSCDLLRHIRGKKYNLVIDLFCNPRTALLTFLSGAKYRVGFNFRNRKYAYNIKKDGRGAEIHNVEFNLDALRCADIPVVHNHLNLSVNIVHKEFADKLIADTNIGSEILFGIAVTGGWESKRYKIPDYIELMKKILSKFDVKFLLIWGNKTEKAQCEEIKSALPGKTVLIPDCSIRYLAALIQKCALVIGNDSGPLHVSVAVRVPVLGIYGPTNPLLQGPYGKRNITVQNTKLECLSCNLLNCKIGNICMTELSKDFILSKLDELIEKNKLVIPKKR